MTKSLLWHHLPCNDDQAAGLAAELGVNPVIARLLCLLTGSLRGSLLDRQLQQLAARRARATAVQSGERIDDLDTGDDEAVARELRRERALAAAASVPRRTQPGRPQGKAGKRRR